MKLFRTQFILLLISLGLVFSSTAKDNYDTSSPGLQKHGRWFIYNNKYFYLVGVDAQQLAADQSLDYNTILDKFQAYRINKIRIWLDAYWDPKYLHPWEYDLPSGKYNLDVWNSVYWNRLKSLVLSAQSHDIIVEISLFSAYPSEIRWWTNTTWRVAWNKDFNVNGAFTSNYCGHFYPDFFSLNHIGKSISGKTLNDYQRELVDKTLAELGSYPNVYFEIMNEFYEHVSNFPDGFKTVAPWQQYWADYLRQSTSCLITAHANDAANLKVGTRGAEYFWDKSSVDILNYHLYNVDPGRISNLLHSSQRKNKILQNNESFEWYANEAVSQTNLDNTTKEAWGWFLSGGHYGFYNGQHTEYSGWDQLGERAKVLRDLAEKVKFWQMSPVDQDGNEYDSLITQGPGGANHQVLANPGSEYVAFFWGTPENTKAVMNMPAGNYGFEWYDPRSKILLNSGVISGGGSTVISPPSPSSWDGSVGLALFIIRK